MAEIQEKARRDIEFRKMLFANPQEALGEFGIVIPGSSPDDKITWKRCNEMYDRAEFYRLFYCKILNNSRMKPLPCLRGSV